MECNSCHKNVCACKNGKCGSCGCGNCEIDINEVKNACHASCNRCKDSCNCK